jgi:hypothetical protein
VSSLWTPQGEHRVPRETEHAKGSAGEGGARPEAPAAAGPAGATPGRAQSAPAPARPAGPEAAEPSEEEIRRLTEELAAAPVEDVIANHCYGLFELAALHLSVRPAQLDKARLAIDGLGLLVEGLGERLGPHAKDLSEGLNQLRLFYVNLSDAPGAGNRAGEA